MSSGKGKNSCRDNDPATKCGTQPLSGADQNSGGANGGCSGTVYKGDYCSTRDGSPSLNGNGNGKATGKPCAGCVGKADNKNPPGQFKNGGDHNAGYECDRNHGIGRSTPAHTGCKTVTPTCTSHCGPPPNCKTTGTCPPPPNCKKTGTCPPPPNCKKTGTCPPPGCVKSAANQFCGTPCSALSKSQQQAAGCPQVKGNEVCAKGLVMKHGTCVTPPGKPRPPTVKGIEAFAPPVHHQPPAVAPVAGLPNTGAPGGAGWLTTGGLLLLAAGGVLMLLRRRQHQG
ncbi:MAG TPA: LPXTG cell wall anchor domain-containing protein [Nocardioidaceae bacterium]|nr:LPXTG cell wall anchor domain-containing protein [Nocardioidaceae bacterium]